MPTAVTLTTLPKPKTITLGTADNVTLVTIPPRCGLVSFFFTSTAGKVVMPDDVGTLAQDDPIGSADYLACDAGAWYPIDPRPTGIDDCVGSRTFAITGSTGASVSILCERGES